MTSQAFTPELVTYYERKTQTILRRYGPGPRVHYHTGLIDEPEPLGVPAPVLRQRLVASQEQLLHHAGQAWRAKSTLCGEVLDVGCGLGGGAIFWAQEFGARVTAVTIAPSHIDWVKRFATQAGVESRVHPLVCDAAEVPGDGCFDAAVAIDSSSSFPRGAWFRRLVALLRPRGRVFIADCFLERPEYEELFSRHWYARIGTISEYLVAAQEAGLQVETVEDLSYRAARFWAMNVAFLQAEVQEKNLSPTEIEECRKSLHVHTLVQQGLVEGGLRYALVSFTKAGDVHIDDKSPHSGIHLHHSSAL